MTSNGKFELSAVIVLYACSDGKLRPVKFSGKNAKQIHGYITHIQGGKVDFRDEPALVVHDTPQVRAAMEAIENPPKKKSWLDRIRPIVTRPFSRNSVNPVDRKAIVDPPDEDHSVSTARKIDIEPAKPKMG